MTGISSRDLLIGKATKKSGKKGKQSIYRCQHCGYISEQKAQGATHVRSEHLGHCLQCHLCEPLPNLSNIVATEVDPKDIIIGIKEEATAESDSDSDSDKE